MILNNKSLLLIPVFLSLVAVVPFALIDGSQNEFNNDLVTPLTLNGAGDEQFGARDNVEITIKDSNGNVKFHDTTHNKIVTHGENCAAKMIFGSSGGDETGTSVCVGAINQGFNVIALGESSTAAADSDTDLVDPADESGLSTPVQGTITWTNSTNGSYHTVVISSQFTNTGATETIREVGLFNSTTTSTNGMYARAVISDAAVANGDDITINWTFETGEATVP